MCGVIGYMPIAPTEPTIELTHRFARLFGESTVRGLHAFGIAWEDGFHRTHDAMEVVERFDPKQRCIAHARYSTSGNWQNLDNAQPIILDDAALVFNGVISMCTKEEMEAEYNVKLNCDNDGELLLHAEDDEEFITTMRGSFAGIWLRNGDLYAARNERRPLWTVEAWGARWWASTRDIFLRAGFPEPIPLTLGVRRYPWVGTPLPVERGPWVD